MLMRSRNMPSLFRKTLSQIREWNCTHWSPSFIWCIQDLRSVVSSSVNDNSSKSIAGNINSVHPHMRFGDLVRGWCSRPRKRKVLQMKRFFLSIYHLSWKRSNLRTLFFGFTGDEKRGTGRRDGCYRGPQDDNVGLKYTCKRFKDQQASEQHQNTAPATKVKQSAQKLAASTLGCSMTTWGYEINQGGIHFSLFESWPERIFNIDINQ